MENLNIKETKHTPEIILDSEKGIFNIKGKSYPENTFDFYEPMMEWISKYFETSPQEITEINMEIMYFNSSSSRLFFDLFEMLNELREKHKIIINWVFDEDNESAREAGEDFIEDFENLDIRMKVI